MENSNITLRIEKNLKEEAIKLFNDLGLTLSSAIVIFLKQSVREQKIPFEVSKKEEITFLSDKDLKEYAVKEMKRHRKAYEELAK